MSNISPAFNIIDGKPSTKEDFDAQAEKWRKAQQVFFNDIEKRRNEEQSKK